MNSCLYLLRRLFPAILILGTSGCGCMTPKTKLAQATETVVQVRHLDGTPVLGCRAGFYNTDSGESRGLVTADSRGNIHLVFARSTNKYLLVVEGPIGTSPQRGRWKEHAVALSRQYPIPPGELPPPCLVVKFDLKTDDGPVPGH